MISERVNEWQKRKAYANVIENNKKFYNSWRSIKFTTKGKKIGYSPEFNTFESFYETMFSSYTDGYIITRLDKSKPFSKDNCIWCDKMFACALRENSVKIEYQGLIKTAREWASILNLSYTSVRIRYYRHKDWKSEWLLFGKPKDRKSKPITDWKDNPEMIRSKASKMISSYRCKDNRNGVTECDIDIEWMIDNIIKQKCTYCSDTNRIGADRIDNNKGHTKCNVVPCCYECNCARNNNFTHEEMKVIGETIKKIKENRKLVE